MADSASATAGGPLAPSAASRVDRLLVYCLLLLLGTGLLMLGSASMEFAGQQFADPWHFVKRQLLYMGLGLIIFIVGVQVPVSAWRAHSGHLLCLGFVLLLVVLIPGIGREVNGSQRWIALGVFNLQASELAKFCVIAYVSAYLVRHQKNVRTNWMGFLKPLLVLATLIVMLLMEPDFGAVVVMLGAVLGMLFLAGVRLQHFLLVVCSSLLAVGCMALLSPYRLQRITAFLDPWSDPFGSGYQLVQSLIAFGRGEWVGLGLGRSVQKLFYLPEAHTDFVFAIVGEELGFMGAIFVIGLFALLVWRILLIAQRAERRGHLFAAYLGYGIALLFAIQSFINIGVNVGLLPTKGLTLPFFSYGGSSLLVSCLMLACVVRINYELELPCRTRS